MIFLENVQFQRIIWQHRLLPYQAELEKEADHYFSNIKSGMGYSVLMRDARPGLLIWVYELDRFIKLHSFRFTKLDHVNMLNLLYNALIMKNLDFRAVKVLCCSIGMLLSRKSIISRGDVNFDWRPLYDLYVQVVYKNLEEDGVFLIPEDLKKILGSTIVQCNRFFEDSATQEILDEVRPYFCPWDDSSMRGLKILSIFLPTCLTKEENDQFGAKLWIDELLYFLTSPGTLERLNILLLFARLTKDSPGYFDFSPYFNELFTFLLSSLKIEIGVDRIVAANNGSNEFSALAQIFAYSFGMAENKIQECFSQLFLSLESYFHPSNTGQHTKNLLSFLHKLVLSFLNRVSRERFHAKKFVNQIPENIKITDVQIENFVKSILPCLEYAAFAKQSDDSVPSIIRLLAFLSPGIIVPFVLDLVYPSLQTLTEPHRLTQSLQILSRVCVVIARDRLPEPGTNVQRLPVKSLEDFEVNKSYRRHAIILMNNLLPGLDINDAAKCGLVFQILAIFMMLVPVVDCSQAPLDCKDLTPEEEELCSETASFELFVEELMRKIFSMIVLLGSSVSDRQDLTSTKSAGKNMEEMVMEKGVLLVFRSLVRNCSSAFYNHITEQFFNFVNEHLFNSKPAMDAITKMAGSIVGNHPEVQFPRFFNFAVKKFEEHYHAGSELEEEVDRALIWYMTFAAELVRNSPGHIIMENKSLIDSFIGKILKFKSPNIFKLVAVFAQNVLHCICSTYPIPSCLRTRYDQPFDKFLPLRHWAEPVNKDDWTLNWHIPSDEEVEYATKLVDQFITKPLQQLLANFKDTTDKEILKILKIAHHALVACADLLPFYDGQVLNLIPMAVPNVELDVVTVPPNVKKITAADGSNYRTFLFKIVQQIGERLLNERENDTKSSIEIIHIIRTLTHERGSNSTSHQYQASSFQMTKKLLNDPLRGFPQTIESIMEGSISLMHTKRLVHRPLVGLTSTHLEALQLAFRFSTSTYALVRQTAQKLLDGSFTWWSYSYKLFVDNLVQLLENRENNTNYEQFKGALYVLANGKQASILTRQDWEVIEKIWPALCLAESPDPSKQSIIALFDYVQDLIISNHTSFQIEFKFPDDIFKFAETLLVDYEGNIHKALPLISNELIQGSNKREAEINAKNKRTYDNIASSLCQICCNKALHWRHVDFAQTLLSLLLRRDTILHSEIILHFFQLLISDSIKTRKLATSFCASWFKINRQKAKKIVKNINLKEGGENNGVGANFLLYDADKLPSGQKEWDNSEFHHKPHWGFYTWPKEFKVYASPLNQDWSNREYSQFSQLEQSIIGIFKDTEFLQKFASLYSLEDEKDDKEFDAVHFSLFNRIFRTFNDNLLDNFIAILDPLLVDNKESCQRLAAEITAGMICGSKLWKFEKREKVLKLLIPRLETTLLEVPQENEKYWGTCIATICGSCEPRQIGWLIELLFQLINKPTDISSQIKTRIYLLQSALNEFEWLIPFEWKRLANYCIKLTDNTFQNVRQRAGSCLATCAFFYHKDAFYYPELDEKFKYLKISQVIDEINGKLEPLWNEAINSIQSQNFKNNDSSIKHVDSTSVLLNGKDEFKKEKLHFLTLISFLYSLKSMYGTHLDTSSMKLLPLFTHYANDKTDEELQASCITHIVQNMGLSIISNDQINVLFEVCQTIQEKGSWKAKITLLRFLQVFIFTNLFILRAKTGTFDFLQSLLLKLLVDVRFEVREASAETLSGLVRAGIISVDEQLVKSAETLASSPKQSIERHSGVLALASIVLAFPYSVPSFLPKVLMHLCKHATEPQPIYGTVKRALSEFKRTHQDEWHEHKLEFTEDQLQILTDLIVSPTYYV
ncbi:unnamed protein product [Meloidogyne enterolobii]|uniref:Uncharacterized protein n=1 Tax=Meloidogyne enterolobii TaxID=390850 RepID=A0ACB0XTT8_MELEN